MFDGILLLLVLVSLGTKQTDAKIAAACYGGQFDPPPRCGGGFSVNVRRVTIGSDTCGPYLCCPSHNLCEVSADEVEPAFYQSVMATCHGRQDCDGLRAPSRWTSLTDCDDSRLSDDDESDQVFANYVKIQYNCTRVPSHPPPPPPSRTTATPDEDLTPEMTTWDDFQTLVMGSRVSDPVTPYDVTTDSGEASGTDSGSDQGGLAVGVVVGVVMAVLLVVGIFTALLVIFVLRRRKEKSIHCHDNAASQVVMPSASPRTTEGSTSDPPPLDPTASPRTTAGSTSDPPSLDPTASSENPHPPSHRAAQDTDYDVVNSPYVNQEVANSPYVNQEVAKSPYVNQEVVNTLHAKVKGQTAPEFGLDLRLVDNTMYDAMTGPQSPVYLMVK